MSGQALIMPWIIFKVCDGYYAVHSRYTTGISILPDDIEKIPDAPEIYKGIVEYQGESYPFLDIRRLFNFKSMGDECEERIAELQKHKRENMQWADELKSSVKAGVEFLRSDMHGCKFGKWLDELEESDKDDKKQLLKLKAPHTLAHECALKIAECLNGEDTPERNTHINELLNTVTEECLPEIVSIIDDTCNRIKTDGRESMILLNDGRRRIAIAVDRVIAVEELSRANGKDNMLKIINSPYFTDMGVCGRIKGGILIADDDKLLEKAMKDNVLNTVKN